ncbi:MAG: hypothetical protein H6730_35835 [Deltaproteobacteria bacterium]|nr:hypothetical protein [Deltaproteobacteria bacterium]
MRITSAAACAVLLAACGGGEEDDAACQRLDEAWHLDSIPLAAAPAPSRPEPADVSSASKLAVAVYHFNVQYVAGGLKGFPDGTYVPEYDLDEAQVEDRIVQEGLRPVLDLFLAHPSFKADIELQAYMLEIIAQRHPEVLEKMRTLATRGQIDFASFHYSDQLYVAYPRRDLEVSLDLTKAVFDRAGIPLGRSIFTQEGQFAAGQLAIADGRGYEVSILPKNLFRYQFGDAPAQASVLYRDPAVPDHTVILGAQGWSGTDGQGQPLEVRWTFMDDGEIAFSEGELNPYFGLDYVVDPDAIAAHVAELEAMEADGYVHATVAEAVRAMKARGVTPAPLPPVLDGTWQPSNTGNVFRWMGGGGLFRTQESDGDTLAAIWRGRAAAAAAQSAAEGVADERLQAGVMAAWREALLAEVSDSTGWNPFVNEVRYSRERAAAAEAIAQDVLLCGALAVPALASLECAADGTTLADLGAEVLAEARGPEVVVERCTDPEIPALHRIVVRADEVAEVEELFDPSEQATLQRELEVRFAWEGETFTLIEALRDAPVSHTLGDYVFEWIGIPLPEGLLSLGADRWVVQDHATGRVAARVSTSSTARDQVSFLDMTVARSAPAERHFYVLEGVGPVEAAAFARRMNR